MAKAKVTYRTENVTRKSENEVYQFISILIGDAIENIAYNYNMVKVIPQLHNLNEFRMASERQLRGFMLRNLK